MSLSKDEILPPFLIKEDLFDINKEQNSINILKKLKEIINSLESNIASDINSDIYIKLKENFTELSSLLEILKNAINTNNKQKESLLRKNENDLRVLYGKYFNQKLINEVQENKISALQKREKEYELLKQKTGAIVCNGQVICNERKENEIIILRTENSLLKTAIKNNEDLLKEKNEIISSLNNDILLYKTQIDELRREKYRKYSSFSNINININESKKDFNKKKASHNKVYLNNVVSSNKEKIISNNKNNNNNLNNKKCLTNKNNLNNLNNIYSSYQINSQLMNKINKNNTQNKDEINQANNIPKNVKNEIMDSNKTYLIKYISVNKSLFTPKNQNHKIDFNNNDKKTLQLNRIRKNKFILNNNLNKEYKTVIIEPQHIDDKNIVKVKKINNRLNIKHKKSYSIQFHENSIKNLIQKNKEKTLFIGNENFNNNNNFFFTKKKIENIKTNTSKNKNSFSSIIKTFTDGFRTNENKNNQKYLNYFMKSYDERRNNIGRNFNYSHIINESKDNSLSFLQKTFVNRTNYEKMF